MDGHMLKRTTDEEDGALLFNDDPHELILRHWYTLVADYARRSLTFGKYPFPAIAGLVGIVHREVRSDCIAGIWDDDVERGLLWRLNQNGRESQLDRIPS